MSTEIANRPDPSKLPPNAVWVKDEDGVLTQVTSADGKRVLWSLPSHEHLERSPDLPIAASPVVPVVKQRATVTPELISKMQAVRDGGGTIKDICLQFGVQESTVGRHTKARNKTTVMAHDTDAELPDRENPNNGSVLAMPQPLRYGIDMALGSAGRAAAMSTDSTTKTYFEGYLAGYQAALALLCGGLNIDVSFLMEGTSDD
jgi:hypothetical protein